MLKYQWYSQSKVTMKFHTWENLRKFHKKSHVFKDTAGYIIDDLSWIFLHMEYFTQMVFEILPQNPVQLSPWGGDLNLTTPVFPVLLVANGCNSVNILRIFLFLFYLKAAFSGNDDPWGLIDGPCASYSKSRWRKCSNWTFLEISTLTLGKIRALSQL